MQLGCKSLSWSVTHSIYFIQSLPLLVWHAQLLCGLDAAAQLASPNLQILQLLLLHEPSQGSWKLQQRRGWDDTPAVDPLLSFKSFHLVGFDFAVCGSSYLPATRREACVTAQPPLQVVSAFSMPAQVDGSGLDVDVHQVVDDLTLDVVLDAVDEVAPSHVYHLNEGELPGGREHGGDAVNNFK